MKSFNLKLGKNTITYSVTSEIQGTSSLEAFIYNTRHNIGELVKKPYKDYVIDEIHKPLQMNLSGFDYNLSENQAIEAKSYLQNAENIKEAPSAGYVGCKPCGGLLTNIEDLSKYLTFLLKNNCEKVLKNTKELMSPCVMFSPKKNNGKRLRNRAYGLGIFMGDYDEEFISYCHSGGTCRFGSYWVLIPELDFGMILWQNSDYKGLRELLENLLENLGKKLKGKKFGMNM